MFPEFADDEYWTSVFEGPIPEDPWPPEDPYTDATHNRAPGPEDDRDPAKQVDPDDLPKEQRRLIPGLIPDDQPGNPPRQDDHPLDAVRAWLARYLRTVHPADLDLLTLWAAHTHLANECYTTPRLLLDSPVPGAGKTTCLEHLQRLCWKPVQMTQISSPALLVRLLEDGVKTMLIDEADRSLRPDNPMTPDLVAILNSGYKRGATRPVLEPVKGGGWVPKEMPTFAPVAMAGNQPKLPEDTTTRTIRVLLLPDKDGTVQDSDWELIEPDALNLGDWLAAWADQHRDHVAATRPPLPDGITGRFREKWLPLARVAAMAGGRWPAVVDQLAVQDREQVEMDKQDGLIVARPHVVLLGHLAEVWPDGESFAPSDALVADLVREFPAEWGTESSYGKALTVQRMGRMLASNYKVNSQRRPDGDRARGYRAADLAPVWSSMAVEPPNTSSSSSSSGTSGSNRPPMGEPDGDLTCLICGETMSFDDGTGTHPGCEDAA